MPFYTPQTCFFRPDSFRTPFVFFPTWQIRTESPTLSKTREQGKTREQKGDGSRGPARRQLMGARVPSPAGETPKRAKKAVDLPRRRRVPGGNVYRRVRDARVCATPVCTPFVLRSDPFLHKSLCKRQACFSVGLLSYSIRTHLLINPCIKRKACVFVRTPFENRSDPL